MWVFDCFLSLSTKQTNKKQQTKLLHKQHETKEPTKTEQSETKQNKTLETNTKLKLRSRVPQPNASRVLAPAGTSKCWWKQALLLLSLEARTAAKLFTNKEAISTSYL